MTMSNKQARLVAAISDAMQAQGFSQNNLARVSGVAQSMISAAILGKYDLKEEKWRLLCEALALDYDQIVEGPEPEEIPVQETPAPATEVTEVTEVTEPVTDEPAAEVQQESPICCDTAATPSVSASTASSLEDGAFTGGAEPARLVMVLEKAQARIVAEYMAGKLRDDVRKGTFMPLEDLYTLLSYVKQLQEITEEE